MSTPLLFQIQSFLILSLIFVGVYLRKKKRAHVRTMLTAIIWDIVLILQIELNRSAIVKASKAIDNSMALNIHVSIAVLTVIYYFGMIYTGRKILKGDYKLLSRHKVMGWSTLLLRVLTFVTSFWAVSPN